MSNFLEMTKSSVLELPDHRPAPDHLLEIASELGVATEESEFRKTLNDYLPRRSLLIELCSEDGWVEA